MIKSILKERIVKFMECKVDFPLEKGDKKRMIWLQISTSREKDYDIELPIEEVISNNGLDEQQKKSLTLYSTNRLL